MTPACANSRKCGSDFEMYSRAPKRSFIRHLDLSSPTRLADRDELRGRLREPLDQVADDVELDPVQLGVLPRMRRVGRNVELVVDVDVRRVALLGQRRDRLARELERQRLVPQPVPVGVGDDGALVADDRRVEVRRLERLPHGLDHASGHDDDRNPGRLRTRKRRERARVERAVLPHERAVEVGRDDVDVAGEVLGEEDQPAGLPPVAFTT